MGGNMTHRGLDADRAGGAVRKILPEANCASGDLRGKFLTYLGSPRADLNGRALPALSGF